MKTISVIALGCILGLSGCITSSWRNAAVVKVANHGANVSTRHRYHLSCVYVGDKSQRLNIKDDFFSKFQPNVFAADGIPVSMRIRMKNSTSGFSALDVLLHMCTFTIFPVVVNTSVIYDCFIEVDDIDNNGVLFEVVDMGDNATSHLVPSPLWWYTDSPDVEGCPVFSQHGQTMILTWLKCEVYNQNKGVLGKDEKSYGTIANVTSFNINLLSQQNKDFPFDGLMQRAFAYGVAVKLKELEDSGKIDAMLKKKAAEVSTAPKHNIIRLDRDSDKTFTYSFELELAQNPTDFKKVWQAVLLDFAKSLKEDYRDAFPSADVASLEVSFSGFKREGLRLSGHAAVLTLKPISLDYNAHTRSGKLSVRFTAGQESEAKVWIQRNIKRLIRDKNIALTTGAFPPEANYQVIEAKTEGNVMAIEFKAE